MRFVRHAMFALGCTIAFAGCGRGHAMHVLPNLSGSGSAVPRGTESTNTNLFDGTLWLGGANAMAGRALWLGGPSVELDYWRESDLSGPVSRAITVAPDDTAYELTEKNGAATGGWRLHAYAPGSLGSARPEEIVDGPGDGRGVILVGDAIDVWARSGDDASSAATLYSYAYGAGNLPRPIRTLPLGTDVIDVASDGKSRIHVARSSGVDVYAASATCACSPIRHIAIPSGYVLIAIAVASDGTVYLRGRNTAFTESYLGAFAPGNNGPYPTRMLGPFYVSRSAAPRGYGWEGTPVGGMTVDSDGNVYAGFANSIDNPGTVQIDVFAANATGTNARARLAGLAGTTLTSLAVGPRTGFTPGRWTAYLESANVYGYVPETGATPFSVIKGQWHPRSAVPGSLHSWSYPGPITVDSAGVLYASTTLNATYPEDPFCEIAAYRGTTSVGSLACGSEAEINSLSRTRNDEIDAFIRPVFDPTEPLPYVKRFVNGWEVGRFHPASSYDAFAADASGALFFATRDGTVSEYPAGARDGTPPRRTVVLPSATLDAMAASDGTVYVAGSAGGHGYVYAIAPGDTAPSRTIGPFDTEPSALAVAPDHNLYVAVDLTGSRDPSKAVSSVLIYAPAANGNAQPLMRFDGPIPASDPAGRIIRYMAISP